MKKDKEKFVFFHINNATAFKSVLKTYAPANITSVATIIGPVANQPLAFVNLAFSHAGFGALNVTDDLQDTAFSDGQFKDSPNLGDDTSTWEEAFKGTNVDGVFLIGSNDVSCGAWCAHFMNLMPRQESITAQYRDDLNAKFGDAWTIVYDLDSAARPGAEKGHERE